MTRLRDESIYCIYDGTVSATLDIPSVRKPFSLAEFITRSKIVLTKKEQEEERAEQRRTYNTQQEVNARIFEETREHYNEIRMIMMNDGFTFHQDARIKKHYRGLENDHHEGHRRDVHFKSSVTGRCLTFKFYENAIHDNQHGGEYTHDKMKEMPYLTRLGVLRIHKKIVAYLQGNGFVDNSRTYSESGLAAIMKHRQELMDFQGPDFYNQEKQFSYNIKDAHGVEMRDGDFRYFWNYRGFLQRGTVYRNINNMWWIHTGPYSYRNAANFELFTWNPSMGKRRKLSNQRIQERLAKKLDDAVKSQAFERAVVLRDLLRKKAA